MMAPTCEQNVQIKLTPKNFLLIIFNVVYIEVNETRKKLTILVTSSVVYLFLVFSLMVGCSQTDILRQSGIWG
jgi:hypothetical protein